jgi:predicted metal-dependent hydrolase
VRNPLYPADALKRRAMEWALKLRVNPRVIRIQPMRRKWGSCSSKGTITFATDLLDRERRFQDFVIVHELLHLRVRNHGRLFQVLMSAHVPGWRALDTRMHSAAPRGATV